MTVAAFTALLAHTRFRFSNEADLQAGIAQVLTEAGISFWREVRLDARSRLDFLLEGGIAVEVKIAGQFRAAELLRQITRYAEYQGVTAIVVVSNRAVASLPAEVSGKPVQTHFLVESML